MKRIIQLSLKNYIKNKKVNHFSHSGIEIFIKDPLPDHVNMRKVIKLLTKRVPQHLLTNLEVIYVGVFPELEKREIQAMFENSSIFITNNQKSNQDMLDDLVHEVAHSVEEIEAEAIYSDKEIEREFLGKRREMWVLLKNEGYNLELNYFLDPDFNREFDNFLYMDVGYPILSLLTVNLFYSPYGATSLREYFANGFEAFFMREDIDRLKAISPKLFTKLVELLDRNKGKTKNDF